MKVIISCKNYNASDRLKDTIEKKFEKLGKYFSRDIVANVTLTAEKGEQYRLEATLNAVGTIFRAEERNSDPYTCLDKVVDKLASQMSKFKTKLLRKHKETKQEEVFAFAEIPDYEEPEEEIKVVRTKKFELIPMSVDEAIMQMELVEHNFFVFLNMETDSVSVVYKRNDGNYGLLDTKY
ncbi:ribosome hibernation-promoting factor, HPF/YfiA family [Bacilliculturomica massiliensis]|uniref:ribosome hibernation-promoting factor, HPF/YfiA family n=1 Tax=Bacilliculturomica massiliensis TaxID=1917867 RepID=UPI0010312FA9|nr:ribosome-associated translation inhibitor RaiA [Bacilliculturomica massiliensis]